MMNHPVEKCIPGKASSGLTLIDLITTIAIMGILAGISIPTMTTYAFKAQLASLRTTLDHLMDGEDLCFFGNDTFHPENGSINIPKGVKKEIPEIAYTFPKGHNHHYMIYGTTKAGEVGSITIITSTFFLTSILTETGLRTYSLLLPITIMEERSIIRRSIGMGKDEVWGTTKNGQCPDH